MATDYGSGPDLTENLDIHVDDTGDVSLVEGDAELSKDLSFRLLNAFDGESFGILDASTREDIRVTTENAITDDDRIESVVDISVIDLDELDRVAVGVTVVADGAQVQLSQEL